MDTPSSISAQISASDGNLPAPHGALTTVGVAPAGALTGNNLPAPDGASDKTSALHHAVLVCSSREPGQFSIDPDLDTIRFVPPRRNALTLRSSVRVDEGPHRLGLPTA
eukprot:COSAG06_NODE_3418_length_5371_cov_196.405918_2_plen_109_part_00